MYEDVECDGVIIYENHCDNCISFYFVMPNSMNMKRENLGPYVTRLKKMTLRYLCAKNTS